MHLFRYCTAFSVAALLVLICAAGMRLETLGERVVWYDEIYTLEFCHNSDSLSAVLRSAEVDGWEHPPLHYVAVCAAMQIEDSIVAARAPSAIAGILTVLLLFGIASRLGSPQWGLASAAIGAFSLYHVNYSMDARPYALLVCFVCAEYFALYSLLQRRSYFLWILLVLSGAGAIYTHHFGLIMQGVIGGFICLGMCAALYKRRVNSEDQLWRSYLWSLLGMAVIALSYAPQVNNFIAFASSSKLAAIHRLNLDAYFIIRLFERWGSGPGWQVYLWVLFVCAGVLQCLTARSLNRLLLCAWFFTPLLLFNLVPFSKFFDIRFIMTALPAFFLLTGLGVICIARWVQRILFSGARYPGAGLIAFILVLLLHYPSISGYLDFRGMRSRCSNFFHNARVLTEANSFCRRHIVLNSLLAEDGRILRPVSRE